MSTATATILYRVVALPRWEATIPVALLGKSLYFPITSLCEVIGLQARSQKDALKADEFYVDALRELPLRTGAGMRVALWIRSGEAALWIARINPKLARGRARENLAQFRTDLLTEASRLFFDAGHTDPVEEVGERGLLSLSERSEMRFACLECGCVHRVINLNGEVTVERESRGEE